MGTKDHGRASAAKALDFGCVSINCHTRWWPRCPTGVKHSGHGKDMSVYRFEEYTRVKHVMSNIEL